MIRLTVPEIDEAEIAAVASVLRSGYLVQGRNVAEFERLVAEYVGARYAVAVSSCTAALHLALLALGIGPGDEVIVPDFTFPATANVVELVGAKAVLVDIDLATFNIDVSQIPPALTERTRAIMPVHLFGLAADMGPILGVAEERGLAVIEDAACALGAEDNGRKCGTMGKIGCFSFHPRKAITTGEGGMVVTDGEELAEKVRVLRNHGMVRGPDGYQFEALGFNYRMTDMQGAIGAMQMGKLEDIIGRRQKVAEMYAERLEGIPGLTLPTVPAGLWHVFQTYAVLVEEGLDRDGLIRRLRERGVEATIGTYALHAQPYYRRRYGWRPGDLPRSWAAYRRSLALPLYGRMTEDDVECVSNGLVAALSHRSPM